MLILYVRSETPCGKLLFVILGKLSSTEKQLLKEGVPMKQIQEWLGHSDISTTANIYAHLDSQSKNLSARTMANTLTLPEAQPVKKW